MKMKIFVLMLVLTAFAAVGFGQKSATMDIKVFFLNEKSDPGIMDCRAVKPVTRTLARTTVRMCSRKIIF